MISAMGSALQGIQKNLDSFAGHSRKISSFGNPDSSPENPPVSIPEEMVGMMISGRGVEANIAVLRKSDEMLGTLIDTLA